MYRQVMIGLIASTSTIILHFWIGEANAMAIPGTDENGKEVLVYDVDKYLKKNPYKIPKQKPQPTHRANRTQTHYYTKSQIEDLLKKTKKSQQELT